MLAEVVADPNILEVLHQIKDNTCSIEDGIVACGILLFLILFLKK